LFDQTCWLERFLSLKKAILETSEVL